jgi:hypothetical protein
MRILIARHRIHIYEDIGFKINEPSVIIFILSLIIFNFKNNVFYNILFDHKKYCHQNLSNLYFIENSIKIFTK